MTMPDGLRDRIRLSRIDVKGFRSIGNQEYEPLFLKDVTVLLGANGAGKSNVILFFKMLNHMMTGALSSFVGKYGADQLVILRGQKDRIPVLYPALFL